MEVLGNLAVGWTKFEIQNLVTVNSMTENLYWEFIELKNLNSVEIKNKQAIVTIGCYFGNLS